MENCMPQKMSFGTRKRGKGRRLKIAITLQNQLKERFINADDLIEFFIMIA
jgi:hypothetical protein